MIGVPDLDAQKRLKALAITTKRRHPISRTCRPPRKPATRGSPSIAGVGLLAPAGTPQAIVEKISKAVQDA